MRGKTPPSQGPLAGLCSILVHEGLQEEVENGQREVGPCRDDQMIFSGEGNVNIAVDKLVGDPMLPFERKAHVI